MRVKDLIAKLQDFDGDLSVVCIDTADNDCLRDIESVEKDTVWNFGGVAKSNEYIDELVIKIS